MSTDRGAVTELGDALNGRHRAVSDAGRWLEVNPALPPALADIAVRFRGLLLELLEMIETDSPELTRCISELVRAKDSAVRAKILDVEVADASA